MLYKELKVRLKKEKFSDCVCLRGKDNYSIRFVKRQVNKCAHVPTKHTCFNASLYVSFVIPF